MLKIYTVMSTLVDLQFCMYPFKYIEGFLFLKSRLGVEFRFVQLA